MHPTVAIVGRPNVGKSTLYNRLLGRRSALVSDMPGLTRDRRMDEAEILGLTVRLIDTAGLEEADDASIAGRMRQQTEAAITEADLVLFVLDARQGVLPDDRVFADLVRRSGKPSILIANKCEGRAAEPGIYEAFALGLGEPVAVSAEHGEGIAPLMRDIVAALAKDEAETKPGTDDEEERPLKLAIVGRPNAGKSTLVNALLGADRMITGPEPGLTRDAVSSDLEWDGRQIRIYDTAGLRRRARVKERAERLSVGDTLQAIRFAEVVVLVVDAECPMEHQDLSILELVVEEGRAVVVAINKWDLVEDKQQQLTAIRGEVERISEVKGVPLVTLSALSGRGLDKLMAAVLAAYERWNHRVSTPDLNRWLEEALGRHAPPAARGRRIKLRYMTQPNARPPTFVVFCSQPQALPKAYHRYLVNGLRATFDLAGVPIRLHLRKGKNPYA
ncbi:MAG: ribosome biogenesis GTPase Der [Hyphomicrobiaceae bacterium]|nr:ribosome biogenesis GTPase Der [Hyphomicrobiaceae bacterium]